MFNELSIRLYLLFHFPLKARWLHFRFRVIHIVTMLFKTDWLFKLHEKWCSASINYLNDYSIKLDLEDLLEISQDEHDAELAEEESIEMSILLGPPCGSCAYGEDCDLIAYPNSLGTFDPCPEFKAQG